MVSSHLRACSRSVLALFLLMAASSALLRADITGTILEVRQGKRCPGRDPLAGEPVSIRWERSRPQRHFLCWQQTCVANRDPNHVPENFGTLVRRPGKKRK